MPAKVSTSLTISKDLDQRLEKAKEKTGISKSKIAETSLDNVLDGLLDNSFIIVNGELRRSNGRKV